jgi:hypothetical protein
MDAQFSSVWGGRLGGFDFGWANKMVDGSMDLVRVGLTLIYIWVQFRYGVKCHDSVRQMNRTNTR